MFRNSRFPSPVRPCSKDIVIHLSEASSNAYVVEPFGGAPQFRCDTYGRALDLATSCARRECVDLFYTDDGAEFTLLRRCRHDASSYSF